MKLILLILVLAAALAAVAAVPAKEVRELFHPIGTCEKNEGDPCSEDDCEQCGWCENKNSFYVRCVRTFPSDPKDPITGVIKRESCDANLWWNPDLKPPGSTVGGACDDWTNLSQAVQDRYRKDPNCVEPVCIYGQDEADKCTGKYWYYDPKVHSPGARDDLICGGSNVWDPSTETCRNRANVAGC